MPRKPTIKQKQAALNLVENGGNIGKAMRDAGYTPATAKTPQKLTESVGWDELMKRYFPDDKLARVLDEGLDATTYRGRRKVRDYETIHKYAQTVLKVRGKLDDKLKVGGDENDPIQIVITKAKIEAKE